MKAIRSAARALHPDLTMGWRRPRRRARGALITLQHLHLKLELKLMLQLKLKLVQQLLCTPVPTH